VRIWDPETGQPTAVLEGHQSLVNAVCAVTVGGQPLLASGSDDRTVRIWDPETGQPTAVLEGHQSLVNAVCAVTVGGQPLLASGSEDRTVRIWDPANGWPLFMAPAHYLINEMAEISGLIVVGLETGLLAIEVFPTDIPPDAAADGPLP
jgi:WD40 repeat protein